MSAEKAAVRIAKAVDLRQEDDAKVITRLKLSTKSIAEIAEITVLTPRFIEELQDACIRHGWCCFQVATSYYAFIRLDAASKFRQMSASKLIEYLED